MDTGLFVLRLVVGLLLVGHGTQKLFGWFGGGGTVGTAWYFRSVGYRRPRLVARLAGGAELFGGLCLAIGFITPLAAAAVIGTMLNAVHPGLTVARHVRRARLASQLLGRRRRDRPSLGTRATQQRPGRGSSTAVSVSFGEAAACSSRARFMPQTV
jgi:hypothetical protein